MNPSHKPAGVASSGFAIVGMIIGFGLIAWIAIDTSGIFKNKHKDGNPNIVAVTTENWKSEVLDSKVPVVVDFWAPWCPPCVRLSPTIDKVANSYAGRIKVAKVNVDDAQELVKKFRISGIPIVFIINKGEVVNVVESPITEGSLVEAIDPLLAGG